MPGFGKIPWRRAWQPTPIFLPGESLWTKEPGGATVPEVAKESDMPRGNHVGPQGQSRGTPVKITWAPRGNHVGPPKQSRGPRVAITWAPRGNDVGPRGQSRASRLSCEEHLHLRCDGNAGNSFPTTQ